MKKVISALALTAIFATAHFLTLVPTVCKKGARSPLRCKQKQ